MGLFDKAFSKGLGDALGGALGSKVTDAMDALEQATGLDFNGDGKQRGAGDVFGSMHEGSAVPGQQEVQQQALQQTDSNWSAGQITDKHYFEEILSSSFGNYVVHEDVPVSTFGGEGKPYNFALYQGDTCAGVIMLVEHNRDNNRAYKGAKAAAQNAGVPFINFYTHMPNERSFVVSRITRLAQPLQ